jgi:15-cis-phytoene synthase
MNAQLTTAYAICRGIARREARNFYYSFLALPRDKRNALSAVYAFMRHADDLSDDESCAPAERLQRLSEWLDSWHNVEAGTPGSDPVFVALADAQQRYSIPGKLLDQLVEGTSMDLRSAQAEAYEREYGIITRTTEAATLHVPQTFADLYRYCYLVASVVGLVCIRIYGYYDPRAEELAERCGIAFQLTNIIRDVREDAGRARVYFPQEDLARFDLSAEEFLNVDALEQSRLKPLLDFEAGRARKYYEAADDLLPMIHEDSRAALWVMVNIYRRLLERIAEFNYDVLNGRIRLGASEKLGILGRGLMKSVFRTI